MTIVDGKILAEQILLGLKTELRRLPFQPVFCDVLVGEDPVARSYVNIKGRRAEEIGLDFQLLEVPASISTDELIQRLQEVQNRPYLSGLIVQMPLPAGLDTRRILDAIIPRVDVDCLGSRNSERFYSGRPRLIPPTASAVMEILKLLKLDSTKKKILIIGKGELVGRPVAFLLKQQGLNVITADNLTQNLPSLALTADVIISGTGQPGLITGDYIKLGAVIIDCGTAESAGSIVGDVDLGSVAAKASFVSPVPGGVGPVTVACLLANVVAIAKEFK